MTLPAALILEGRGDEGSHLARQTGRSPWESCVRRDGPEITNLAEGDWVVIPFQISCGSCYMCDQQLFTQCETTQVRDQGMGAALFGYSELHGAVPGARPSCFAYRRPNTHIKVPDGPSDSRFVYLSDVLPTAWQAATHTLPLDEAPHAYDIFQKKQDGAVKVVLKP